MLKTILTTTFFTGAIAFSHNILTAYATPIDSVSPLIGSIPILQEGKRTGSLFAMVNRE